MPPPGKAEIPSSADIVSDIENPIELKKTHVFLKYVFPKPIGVAVGAKKYRLL